MLSGRDSAVWAGDEVKIGDLGRLVNKLNCTD